MAVFRITEKGGFLIWKNGFLRFIQKLTIGSL